MTATRTMEKARQALDRGEERRALRLGWRAASQALREANAVAVLAVRQLADDASTSKHDRVRRDSEHLSAYCRALLDGAGGGMHPTHPLDALFKRPAAPTARTPCPMCAEDIVVGARRGRPARAETPTTRPRLRRRRRPGRGSRGARRRSPPVASRACTLTTRPSSRTFTVRASTHTKV